MHTEVEFNVDVKQGTGKGANRQLRMAGKTPGILYGPGKDSLMLTFREKDLAKALSTPAKRNVFLKFKSEDPQLNGARALIKDLQVHPLQRVFLHADFYVLDPNRIIHARVPVLLEGTAAGVKLGGIMQVARRTVRVSCLPDNLPESITVDVTAMKPGDSIHVGDLTAPEGVKIESKPALAVCAVISPSGADEETAEEEVEEEAS